MCKGETMKNLIPSAKRNWKIIKDKDGYYLKINNGKEEILSIGIMPDNILFELKQKKIIEG